MQDVVDNFQSRGVKADTWKWTISEPYIERCEAFHSDSLKSRLGISLIRVRSDYRRRLVQFFGDQLFVGDGGFSSEDADLFPKYVESWVSVGSTSSSWPESNVRSMKGFRDWLAPFLGTVLIYDDHPQMSELAKEVLLPIYEYEDFSSIKKLIDELRTDASLYSKILASQREWARANTLEKQYGRLFTKYGVIS